MFIFKQLYIYFLSSKYFNELRNISMYIHVWLLQNIKSMMIYFEFFITFTVIDFKLSFYIHIETNF